MSAPLDALLLVLGGGAGAALRYLADTALRERAGLAPGTSTLLVNALGCLVAGVAAALLLVGARDAAVQQGAAVAVAVCAGFTTFSTASLDALRAALARSIGRAVALTIGQLAACGLAFTVAYIATHRLAGG